MCTYFIGASLNKPHAPYENLSSCLLASMLIMGPYMVECKPKYIKILKLYDRLSVNHACLFKCPP